MSIQATSFAGSVEQATRDNLAGPTPLLRSSEILGSGIKDPGPSLATGMLSDTANSGGEYEEVTAQSIEQERNCIECETGTSPGACGTERGKVGALNSAIPEPAKVGEISTVGVRTAVSPDLRTPVEPAAVEVGCGQAPEVFSSSVSATSKEGRTICDGTTESGESIAASGRSESLHSANAAPACNRGRIADTGFVNGPASCEIRDGVTAGRDRQLNSSFGGGLGTQQPGSMTWGGREATTAPSGRARDRAICPAATGSSFESEVSALEAEWRRAGIISNSIALRSLALNSISASAVQLPGSPSVSSE